MSHMADLFVLPAWLCTVRTQEHVHPIRRPFFSSATVEQLHRESVISFRVYLHRPCWAWDHHLHPLVHDVRRGVESRLLRVGPDRHFEIQNRLRVDLDSLDAGHLDNEKNVSDGHHDPDYCDYVSREGAHFCHLAGRLRQNDLSPYHGPCHLYDPCRGGRHLDLCRRALTGGSGHRDTRGLQKRRKPQRVSNE